MHDDKIEMMKAAKEPSPCAQVERIVMPLVLPDDDGIRPAGSPDICFYCQQKVGEHHKAYCVILKRKVKMRYSFDVEIEMPWSFNKEEIEFDRNDSSWCASNSIEEIEANGDCLCDIFEAKVIEIPETKPYRKNKDGNIVA